MTYTIERITSKGESNSLFELVAQVKRGTSVEGVVKSTGDKLILQYNIDTKEYLAILYRNDEIIHLSKSKKKQPFKLIVSRMLKEVSDNDKCNREEKIKKRKVSTSSTSKRTRKKKETTSKNVTPKKRGRPSKKNTGPQEVELKDTSKETSSKKTPKKRKKRSRRKK